MVGWVLQYYGEPEGEEFENRVHLLPDDMKVGVVCCYVKKQKIGKTLVKYNFYPCIIEDQGSKDEKVAVRYLTESSNQWRKAIVEKRWLYVATHLEIAKASVVLLQ